MSASSTFETTKAEWRLFLPLRASSRATSAAGFYDELMIDWRNVPVGSVAIGGVQAGIYPLASPGGWRVIGRTELRLFDPAGTPPPLLRIS